MGLPGPQGLQPDWAGSVARTKANPLSAQDLVLPTIVIEVVTLDRYIDINDHFM